MAEAAPEGALAEGRRLFAMPCTFAAAAARATGLPPARLPEVAFAGRSNVGKSSLLNALTNRTNLARTSKTPGRTREVNFFVIAERLCLVDLPGYGFARAPKGDIERWRRLVVAYLKGRASLRRTCLLIDARRGSGDGDREVMAMLDGAAAAYQVVLTKADKVKPGELAARIDALAGELAGHPAAHPDILTTSAATGAGLDTLRAELARLAAAG